MLGKRVYWHGEHWYFEVYNSLPSEEHEKRLYEVLFRRQCSSMWEAIRVGEEALQTTIQKWREAPPLDEGPPRPAECAPDC